MAETSCDPKDIAIAALTNLVRLMGAELVAGRHRDDLATFEQAVRDRIGAVNVVGCPPEVADAGLALARSHAEQALTQIRTQAAEAHARDLAQTAAQQKPAAPAPIRH